MGRDMHIPGCCARVVVATMGRFHDIVLAWKNCTEPCRPPSASVVVQGGDGPRELH